MVELKIGQRVTNSQRHGTVVGHGGDGTVIVVWDDGQAEPVMPITVRLVGQPS